ncbi:MAG: dipeptidase [Magnetococcus sp. DMHC-6]
MLQALKYLRTHHTQTLDDLSSFLKIPSVSSDPNRLNEVIACGQFTKHLLQQAGLENVTLHDTQAGPIVTGTWCHAPGEPTVLIYGHYDVQPEDPVQEWYQDPFQPLIQENRIIARGASDDKGQILMHIKAVEAILRVHGRLPINVIFLIEGEEEIGSSYLPLFLQNHQEDLKADFALVSDTSMWRLEVPAITCGLRGLVELEIEATGPNRDLHSGSFGGGVANPIEMLARLLAGIKNEQGQILIPGFYDQVRPIHASEQQWLRDLSFDEAAHLHTLNLNQSWGEKPYTYLERVWLRPTFEINGLWGGYTGTGFKTVLPAKAWAKISMRLVPDQNPATILQLVTDFILKNTPPGVTFTIRHFPAQGQPIDFPMDLPLMKIAQRALTQTFGQKPSFVRDGASIPVVADFKAILHLDTLLLGFAPPDGYPHSPNENMHLPTFHKGTEALVRFFYQLAEEDLSQEAPPESSPPSSADPSNSSASPPLPQTSPFPASLPGLELAASLRRLTGDQELYLHIARISLPDLTRLCQQLREQIQTKRDIPQSRQILHSLKGLTSALGAHTMQQIIQQIHLGVREEKWYPELLDALDKELAVVLLSLKSLGA